MPRGRKEWKPGCKSPNPKGRTPGTKNSKTPSLKREFLLAFEELGGRVKLVRWAKRSSRNYLEFIKILSKMLPREIMGEDGDAITVVIKKAMPPQALPVARPENAADISAK